MKVFNSKRHRKKGEGTLKAIKLQKKTKAKYPFSKNINSAFFVVHILLILCMKVLSISWFTILLNPSALFTYFYGAILVTHTTRLLPLSRGALLSVSISWMDAWHWQQWPRTNLVLGSTDNLSLVTVYYNVSNRWTVALQHLKHNE